MPIPNARAAVVATEKVRDYLLNRDHPDGGSKAAWLHSLGYTRQEYWLLANDLLAIAHNSESYVAETTKFGLKYRVSGELARPGHRPGRVMTVWIVEDDGPPRLVTAYPESSS